MEAFNIVYEGGSDEIVEKKSRFIAHVFPVNTEEEAMEKIESVRKEYWDARHNCHAFVIGEHHEISRCSDDGEPSGTAGRPILEVLTGAGIHNALIVVTRYFGGTLLGTGGLVRAYSQASQAGLAASRVIAKQPGRRVTIDTDYNGVGKLQYLVGKRNLPVLDTIYLDAVRMTVLAAEGEYQGFLKEVTEVTAGKAVTEVSDPLFFAVLDGEPLLFDD